MRSKHNQGNINQQSASARRRVRLRLVLALCVFPLFGTASVAQAPNHLAVIATATGADEFRPPLGDQEFLQGLPLMKYSPGIEIRFFPRSRLSPVVSFEETRFETATTRYEGLRDRFTYIDENRRPQTVELPGTLFSYADVALTGKLRTITGSLHINILKASRIQPFIGIGGGVGLGVETRTISPYVHPLFAQLTGFQYDLPDRYAVRQRLPVAKGIAGVNVYPVNHIVLTLSCGYQNGATCKGGAGMVF